MTTFESTAIINKPVNEVYLFLTDMNNHQQLMPDSVQEWSSTVDEASFSIQSMIKLSLKIEERIENEEIRIAPVGTPPFSMELKWSLLSTADKTEVIFTIVADLNMMMKMMASGPLQKLADHEVQTLAQMLK